MFEGNISKAAAWENMFMVTDQRMHVIKQIRTQVEGGVVHFQVSAELPFEGDIHALAWFDDMLVASTFDSHVLFWNGFHPDSVQRMHVDEGVTMESIRIINKNLVVGGSSDGRFVSIRKHGSVFRIDLTRLLGIRPVQLIVGDNVIIAVSNKALKIDIDAHGILQYRAVAMKNVLFQVLLRGTHLALDRDWALRFSS
jgi:hypothetical protein